MDNTEIFKRYDNELRLHYCSWAGVKETRRFIGVFKDYLGGRPPDEALARQFLGGYAERKPRTFARYVSVIKSLLSWLGIELKLTVKVGRQLSPYVDDEDVQRLRNVIRAKKSHKRIITRDLLLIDLLYESGLRRAEAANLVVGDIIYARGELLVRDGKGHKDRRVPLSDDMLPRLQEFTRVRSSHESVFGLAPASITNKVYVFAQKAGVKLHTHSLRHGSATRLNEAGADIVSIGQFLGHERTETTFGYIGVRQDLVRQALNKRNGGGKPAITESATPPPDLAPPPLRQHLFAWDIVRLEAQYKQEYEVKLQQLYHYPPGAPNGA